MVYRLDSRINAHVPNPVISPPKLLWAYTIVSMILSHIIYSFGFFKSIIENPRHSGESMPGFGTWLKSVESMVYTFAIWFWLQAPFQDNSSWLLNYVLFSILTRFLCRLTSSFWQILCQNCFIIKSACRIDGRSK